MAQQVKDLVLSLLWLWLLLWCRFDPWPGNFCMPQVQPKKKKRERERKERKKKERKQTINPPESSRCSSVEMDPTRIHEDAGLILGLAQ